MGQPYVGEIRLWAANFEPSGWMFCQGQFLSIAEYEVLFQLIGTIYGGDGEETFRLPDLRSRVPIHMGTGPGLSSYQLGETGGVEEVTLASQQIPIHTHAFLASSDAATSSVAVNNMLGASPSTQLYIEEDPSGNMSPQMTQPTGGSQPHTNVQRYGTVNYIISLFGVFPSPT